MSNNRPLDEVILQQILKVRASGKYNMCDGIGIQREAYEFGFYELALFIQEHPDEYLHLIIHGMRD